MAALIDKFSLPPKGEWPEMACNMVEHPEGRWEIKGEMYRPEWGFTPKKGMDTEEAMKLIRLIVGEAKRLYEGTEEDPGIMRMEQYNDGIIRIKIVDKEIK